MRVLKITIARAIWLFPLTDINPKGKAIDTDLIEWLKKTYQFQKYPASAFDFDSENKTLTFAGGRFKSGYEKDGSELYIGVGLSIYTDGLVANTTSSTSDSERFLDEALNSAVKELGLSPPEKIRKKLFVSEMDVHLDKPLSLLNPKLENLARRISELRLEDPKVVFAFAGISFLAEPEAQSKLSPFHIERKINTDWSENRYYTRAPLQTEAHLKLLEELEATLLVQ